jgi:hypothetical protein
MQYGLNIKRLRRALHTVVFDINSSLAAVSVNFFGLCRKLTRTRSTSSSAVNGRPIYFCLHRHPASVNRTNGLVCRRVLCVLCTKCTLHSNHRLRLRLPCGAGGYPPNVLQLTEAYCTNPALVSPLHLQKRTKSDGVRGIY